VEGPASAGAVEADSWSVEKLFCLYADVAADTIARVIGGSPAAPDAVSAVEMASGGPGAGNPGTAGSVGAPIASGAAGGLEGAIAVTLSHAWGVVRPSVQSAPRTTLSSLSLGRHTDETDPLEVHDLTAEIWYPDGGRLAHKKVLASWEHHLRGAARAHADLGRYLRSRSDALHSALSVARSHVITTLGAAAGAGPIPLQILDRAPAAGSASGSGSDGWGAAADDSSDEDGDGATPSVSSDGGGAAVPATSGRSTPSPSPAPTHVPAPMRRASIDAMLNPRAGLADLGSASSASSASASPSPAASNATATATAQAVASTLSAATAAATAAVRNRYAAAVRKVLSRLHVTLGVWLLLCSDCNVQLEHRGVRFLAEVFKQVSRRLPTRYRC